MPFFSSLIAWFQGMLRMHFCILWRGLDPKESCRLSFSGEKSLSQHRTDIGNSLPREMETASDSHLNWWLLTIMVTWSRCVQRRRTTECKLLGSKDHWRLLHSVIVCCLAKGKQGSSPFFLPHPGPNNGNLDAMWLVCSLNKHPSKEYMCINSGAGHREKQYPARKLPY